VCELLISDVWSLVSPPLLYVFLFTLPFELLGCRLLVLSLSTISLILVYRSFHVHVEFSSDCAYRLWIDGYEVASLIRC
jgi:hypothetical protein